MKPAMRVAIRAVPAVLLALAVGGANGAEVWRMMNPTGLEYRDELVRIKVDVPGDISRETYIVTEDGKEGVGLVDSP